MAKDRKEAILRSALELAAERGLGAVSMQHIADRVGITKASLYNHFASRDEIVEALYAFLRRASREKAGVGIVDYDALASGSSLREILTGAVESYTAMVSEPDMFLFYRLLLSERSLRPAAAEILVRETKTMIHATKSLFYALQVKGIADFGDVDPAAFSFAMAVHAIMEYRFDLIHAGMEAPESMMRQYIGEFARLYGREGENDGR